MALCLSNPQHPASLWLAQVMPALVEVQSRPQVRVVGSRTGWRVEVPPENVGALQGTDGRSADAIRRLLWAYLAGRSLLPSHPLDPDFVLTVAATEARPATWSTPGGRPAEEIRDDAARFLALLCEVVPPARLEGGEVTVELDPHAADKLGLIVQAPYRATGTLIGRDGAMAQALRDAVRLWARVRGYTGSVEVLVPRAGDGPPSSSPAPVSPDEPFPVVVTRRRVRSAP